MEFVSKLFWPKKDGIEGVELETGQWKILTGFRVFTTVVKRWGVWRVLGWAFLLGWSVGMGLVVWHRFRQFQIFYYDFGIFATSLWRFSRLQPPLFDHLNLGQINILGDHFNPSFLLFAPLFWLTSRPQILLFSQVAAVAFSGLILWKISLLRLKNQFLSFWVLFSFLLFPGLQNAVIADFHPEVAGVFFVMLAVYFYFRKRRFWFFLFLLISLGFKESLGIFFFSFGLYIIFSSGFEKLKWGIATSVIGVAWTLLSTKVVIPFISPKGYIYFPQVDSNPLMWIKNFFFPWIKSKTILLALSSFSFLPLFSFAIIGFLVDLGLRFIPQASPFQSWDLGMHYNIFLSVFLGIGMIDGLLFLKKRRVSDRFLNLVAILGVFLVLFINRIVYPTPINLAFNPVFYQFSKNFVGLEEFLKDVPEEGTLMSQNNLASRFINRDFYLLRWEYECYKPKWIVLDVGEGQNPNNFWPIPADKMGRFLEKIKKDPSYRLYSRKNNWYIFERKGTSPSWGEVSRDCIRKSKKAIESFQLEVVR